MKLNLVKICIFFVVLLAGCGKPAAPQTFALAVDGIDFSFTPNQVQAKLGPPTSINKRGSHSILEFQFRDDRRYLTTCDFSGDELVTIRGKTLSVGAVKLTGDSEQSDVEKALGRPTSSNIRREPGESEEIKILHFSPPGASKVEATLFGGKIASFYMTR